MSCTCIFKKTAGNYNHNIISVLYLHVFKPVMELSLCQDFLNMLHTSSVQAPSVVISPSSYLGYMENQEILS